MCLMTMKAVPILHYQRLPFSSTFSTHHRHSLPFFNSITLDNNHWDYSTKRSSITSRTSSFYSFSQPTKSLRLTKSHHIQLLALHFFDDNNFFWKQFTEYKQFTVLDSSCHKGNIPIFSIIVITINNVSRLINYSFPKWQQISKC